MKKLSIGIVVVLILSLLLGAGQWSPVLAQDETPETSPEASPEADPTSTPTLSPDARPLVVVTSYSGGNKTIIAGKTFDVSVALENKGAAAASNVTIAFSSGDFVTRSSGGVLFVGNMGAGDSKKKKQTLTAADSVEGKSVAYITATISYTDQNGTSYSGDATLAFKVSGGEVSSGSWSPSATPTAQKRPQLIISGYQTDVDPLQPGTTFNLALDVKNVGLATARDITSVMGGGSATNSSSDSGTPVPGGVAGASGEFTNFAPLGSSNIQAIGDLAPGDSGSVSQKLIVNVSTNPGTYPVKFSYLYRDEAGNKYQDDQVITLLVYRMPLLEVNYYRAADPMTVGMMGVLPIQVVNLSRSSIILGNMTVTSPAGQMMNNTMLIGTLDAGGYYPIDVSFTPDVAGPAEINIKIQYTDDFNQPREDEYTLTIDVGEQVMEEFPASDGMDMAVVEQPETFWQKVGRFFKGLFGLDSAKTEPETNVQFEGMDGMSGGGGGGAVPVP